MSVDDQSINVSILSIIGGVIGGILTQLIILLKNYLYRPKIEIENKLFYKKGDNDEKKIGYIFIKSNQNKFKIIKNSVKDIKLQIILKESTSKNLCSMSYLAWDSNFSSTLKFSELITLIHDSVRLGANKNFNINPINLSPSNQIPFLLFVKDGSQFGIYKGNLSEERKSIHGIRDKIILYDEIEPNFYDIQLILSGENIKTQLYDLKNIELPKAFEDGTISFDKQ